MDGSIVHGVLTGMVQATETNRLTVLLANEQESWHKTVARLLEPQGVATVSARTGQEALSVLENTPVHLAVLDVQMPQLGGLQVIKLMRDRHAGVAPPTIMLSADLSSHLLRDALGMSIFSVLGKPVDLDVLLDAMARAMRRFYESRWPD